MKFRAEYVTERDKAADIAVRAACSHLTVRSDAMPDYSKVTIVFEAEDNYTARTTALVVQGDIPTTARIRRDAAMFPGAWHDLNEG